MPPKALDTPPPAQQELRRKIAEIQKLELSPEEKARRIQRLMTPANCTQPEPEPEPDEKLCRYCLTPGGLGERPSELVAPCDCIGGQRYCHLDCLRRWQRSVLIMQSPNPRFHSEDSRHERCHVCQRPFKIAPPSRAELMADLTGAELVELCAQGCLIVSSLGHSQRIAMAVQVFQGREVAQMRNWLRGVYIIITANSQHNEGDGSVHAVNLNRRLPDDAVSTASTAS